MSDSPKALLRRFSLEPKHSWGQNFLADETVLERLADEALVGPGDTVVELGAGLGHLTRHLLATGAVVVAVERDRELARVLEGRALPGLRLVEANAAAIDFAAVGGAPEVAVVGNLPYHLTSSILFAVLEQAARVRHALFTLQREVVLRLAARPGDRDAGLLTVLLGLRFDAEHLFDVPSDRFYPPPKVDSAVVRLRRRALPRAEVTSEARFRRLVKAGFAQRRKTLANSLASDAQLFSTTSVAAVLAAAGLDGRRRAETLTVEEFAALERAMGPERDAPP